MTAEERTRQREQRRRIRNAGGLYYRPLQERQGGLYLADRRDDKGFVCETPTEDERDPMGWWWPASARLSDPTRLFRCNCGTWFVGHCSAKQCFACRRKEKNAKFSAERSEKRAEARAARQLIHCESCREPMAAKRSTRKYCSDACRQRAHRRSLQWGDSR
jgi:hypothetical protein